MKTSNFLSFNVLIIILMGSCDLYAQKSCSDIFLQTSEERKVINRILNADFEKTRNLQEYAAYLGDTFAQNINSLGPGDIFLDLGAGNAAAIRQYLTMPTGRWVRDRKLSELSYYVEAGSLPAPENRANVIALGYNKLKLTPAEREEIPASKFQELTGRFFEDISDKELSPLVGKISLISSYYGVLSYVTPELFSAQLQRSLNLLKPGGHLHFFTTEDNIGMDRTNLDPNITRQELLAIKQRYFEHIEGVQLIEFGYEYGLLTIVLQRTDGPVVAPVLLPVPGTFRDDSPPRRTFRLNNSAFELHILNVGLEEV